MSKRRKTRVPKAVARWADQGSLDKAQEEGREAFEKGEPFAACPYDDPRAYYWKQGWKLAVSSSGGSRR
jgi:hypothetical protein